MINVHRLELRKTPFDTYAPASTGLHVGLDKCPSDTPRDDICPVYRMELKVQAQAALSYRYTKSPYLEQIQQDVRRMIGRHLYGSIKDDLMGIYYEARCEARRGDSATLQKLRALMEKIDAVL